MRQRWRKWTRRFIIIIVAYALLLSTCIGVVLLAPYISHSEFLNNLSVQAAQEYAANPDLGSIELYSLSALVYDVSGEYTEGSLPRYFHYTDNAREAFGRWPEQVLPQVLSGKKLHHVGFVLPKRVGVIYIGEPIWQDGSVVGAFFLVRDLHDLYPTMISICAAYTLFYILAVVCLVWSIQKKQKYLQLQNDYVANFSHDLKSPITSIKALAETLHADLVPDDATRHKYYSTIINEAGNLQYVVSGILELSAMQNRQTKLSRQICLLADELDPTIEKYRMLCYDMMIGFRVSDHLSDLPPVYTNGKAVARILDILLDNAVKFVGVDGEIALDIIPGAKYVTVCVRDNGCGISTEDQVRIFDRFYMGDPSHQGKGNGLGLAIARELTTSLHERIWVESEPRKGTAFYFTVRSK